MILFTADQNAGLKDGYVWKSGDRRRMRTEIERREHERRRRRHVPGSAGFTNLHLGGDGSAGDGTFFGLFGGDGGGGSDGGGCRGGDGGGGGAG